MHDFRERVRRALALERSYSGRSGAKGATPAAVLILFGFGTGGPEVLLTRRTERVEKHKGQMAFPGGMVEPGESAVEAALRETEEEVGIPRAQVAVEGCLPPFHIPTSGFDVTPVVAWLGSPPSSVALTLNEHEIAEALWVPWKELESPDLPRRESFLWRGVSVLTPVFPVAGHRVWGATAYMLEHLIERLRSV